MAPSLQFLLAAAAFVGHFSIAVWLFNRLHALAWPRRAIKMLEKLLLMVAACVVVFYAAWWIAGGMLSSTDGVRSISGWIGLGYLVFCWIAAAAAIPNWIVPKIRERTPPVLESNDTTVIDVSKRLGYRPVHGREARFFASLPGNELLRIAVQRKTLRLNHLPRELDRLTIAHLSDLHMTGHVGREFYDVVVDETNALAADLIVITGDILEKERCLPWIELTLGRLQARYGKYFVLGNHERRLVDVRPLRQALIDAGLVDLGGRCEPLTLNGAELLLAGTELPWFGKSPLVPQFAEPRDHGCPGNPQFRLLLSHTPDRFSWAKSQGFDLMLAGHCHGGQIRLPFVGALIVPSLYGFRYAGGVYCEAPTLLHVSRGLGGIHPIRLNCPPELALLTLRSAS